MHTEETLDQFDKIEQAAIANTIERLARAKLLRCEAQEAADRLQAGPVVPDFAAFLAGVAGVAIGIVLTLLLT